MQEGMVSETESVAKKEIVQRIKAQIEKSNQLAQELRLIEAALSGKKASSDEMENVIQSIFSDTTFVIRASTELEKILEIINSAVKADPDFQERPINTVETLEKRVGSKVEEIVKAYDSAKASTDYLQVQFGFQID